MCPLLMCFCGCLEGLQRVVLFTEERSIYKMLCESEKVQLAEQEYSLSLQNVGVSLVNNSNSQEVSFIGITRSVNPHTHPPETTHGPVFLGHILFNIWLLKTKKTH